MSYNLYAYKNGVIYSAKLEVLWESNCKSSIDIFHDIGTMYDISYVYFRLLGEDYRDLFRAFKKNKNYDSFATYLKKEKNIDISYPEGGVVRPPMEVTANSVIFYTYKKDFSFSRVELIYSNNMELFVRDNVENTLHATSKYLHEYRLLYKVLRKKDYAAIINYVGEDKRKWKSLFIALSDVSIKEDDALLLSILHNDMLVAPKSCECVSILELYLKYSIKNKIIALDDMLYGNKEVTKHVLYSILSYMFPSNEKYKERLESVVIDKTTLIKREPDYLNPLKELVAEEKIKAKSIKYVITILHILVLDHFELKNDLSIYATFGEYVTSKHKVTRYRKYYKEMPMDDELLSKLKKYK